MTITVADYEADAVSAAKDLVFAELEDQLQTAGIDVYSEDNGVDLLGAADAIVERLIEHDVELPEDLESPHKIGA